MTSFPLSANRFYNLILLGPKIRLQKAANRFLVWFVPALFFTECNAYWLTSASATVLFACTWLMLSPGLILSRSMVSDLLAILEGAWQLYTGQIAHVDFHTAVGTLPFAITALGFIVVGVKPLAFVVGECLSAAVFMVISIVVVKDRLPALPAFLFIAMCVVIPLVPGGIIVWDYPSVFTFAMGYNRFGWTALSILYLLLFIEPRESRAHRWIDLGAGSILILGLFYLKITYFSVAVVAACLALLTSRHIRQNWPLWCGMLLGVLVLVFSPQNGDYRADILSAAGHIRSDLVGLVKLAVRVGAEQLWVAGEVIILFYFWRQRYVPFGDVLFGLYVWISGLFLLSQNAQFITIPLYAVLALLFYMRVAHRLRAAAPPRDSTLVSCTMICVLLPLLLVLFAAMSTLIGYSITARQTASLFVTNENSLRGLAVPTDGDNIIDDVAVSQDKRDSFSRTRFNMPGFQLTDHEYIKTIQALADFLRDQGAASARIFVIDEVNPLPFVLGAAAPRGGVLWPAERSFWQPPEQALREADYVAIPRFPLHRMTALLGLETYREYLSERFVRRYKTPYWDVLERRELP